jgi:ATP-dependent Clp protease ATP-binding subunit ClpC
VIRGSLPRPSELEIYLGDTGIFVRPVVTEEQPVGVGAPAEAVEVGAGTPLYVF